MIHNKLARNLLDIPRFCNLFSVRNSALFMNGAKASENFVFVTPYIDFPERLKQKELLHKDLQKRKSLIDLNKVQRLWSVYEELRQKKSDYDKKKEEISKELGKLIKSEPDSDQTKKLRIQINLIKENIKKLKEPLWSAEEAATVEVLKLPNVLHPQTPHSENKILYTHLTKPRSRKEHLKIGEALNLIHFKKNENYYLKGDAAIFELGSKFYFSDFLKKNNFIPYSNPDFVKSVIIEGCGLDHTNPDATFILHHNDDTKVNIDSRLHLTGGGSLCSFMAYFAKNVLHAKVLPLKLFALGRQYKPSAADEDSLFHVSQSSVVETFGVTKSVEELNDMLKEMIDILKELYNQLGCHYRLSLVSADKLAMWESLRLIVEMYSSSLESYVEVANVSLSGDYISKRLMLTYLVNKQSHFPHVLSGTVLNVPKVIACVLEQDKDFELPRQFKVESWVV